MNAISGNKAGNGRFQLTTCPARTAEAQSPRRLIERQSQRYSVNIVLIIVERGAPATSLKG